MIRSATTGMFALAALIGSASSAWAHSGAPHVLVLGAPITLSQVMMALTIGMIALVGLGTLMIRGIRRFDVE